MTTLVGKDAPLEDSLAHFKHIAQELGIELIEELWLNPLPDLWSVHLSVASCPAIYSNGKGSTHDAALASAYGEIFERLATHMSFSDYFLGLDNSQDDFVHFPDEKWTPIDPDAEHPPVPSDILNVKLREFYNCLLSDQPYDEDRDSEKLTLDCLVDLQSSSYERGVCSIPFTNVRNGEIVYFPVNLLDNLYASNGMSAGNTKYEALVQGLSEIIERYVKAKIIREGLTLPRVPEKILEKYPKSLATLQALQSEQLKAVCYDASLGGKYPVVCVVLFNQSNGTCIASFGSHPIFEVALDRTLTELMQGRTFSDLDGFQEPSFNLEHTSEDTNIESHFVDSTGLLPVQMFKSQPMFKFVAWDFDGSTHDQYKALRYIIDKMGFEIYMRSYQNLGVPVYRVIVPGMSEIYPVSDLLYANNNQFITYQEAIFTLPSSTESVDTYANYLSELEGDNFNDEAQVAKLLGLLPDSESPWSSLRCSELKCLLAIEAEDYEQARDLAMAVLMFDQNLDLDRQRFYRCLVKVIDCIDEFELTIRDYKDALGMIYGEETFKNVIDHIEHKQKFHGLSTLDLNITGFRQHQAMMNLYQKIKHANIKIAE